MWVADVLSRIAEDGKAVGTSVLDWAKIEKVACDYVASKTTAGRYLDDRGIVLLKPTWDMLEEREVVA